MTKITDISKAQYCDLLLVQHLFPINKAGGLSWLLCGHSEEPSSLPSVSPICGPHFKDSVAAHGVLEMS